MKPGLHSSDWVSIHLYYQGSRDVLLLDLVRPLVVRLARARAIRSFFFIRYGLGGPHVRLRLHCASRRRPEVVAGAHHAAGTFFSTAPSADVFTAEEIHRQNRHLLANDGEGCDVVHANNTALESPFLPETDRYGGEWLAGLSLELFSLSSAESLRQLALHQGMTKPRRLSVVLGFLARMALALSSGTEELLSLVRYAEVWARGEQSLFVQRGDEAFDRQPEAFRTTLARDLEPLAESSAPRCRLLDGSRHLMSASAAEPAEVRLEIARSQLHMTANRLGLSNFEEVYLGRILWRALLDTGRQELEGWLRHSSLLPARTAAASAGALRRCRRAEMASLARFGDGD